MLYRYFVANYFSIMTKLTTAKVQDAAKKSDKAINTASADAPWEVMSSSRLDEIGYNLKRLELPIPGFPIEFDLNGRLTQQGLDDLSKVVLAATDDPVFSKVFETLIRTPEFESKSGVNQMTAYHTTIANHQISSRYEHSLHSVYLLAVYANEIGIPENITKLMLVTMLLHDIGHAPFSHTAEMALGELGIHDFDHDLYAREIITSPRIAKTIEDLQYGIPADFRFTAQTVADIIDPSEGSGNLGVLKTIKDLFDRGSYLIQDYSRSHLSHEERSAAILGVHEFLLSVESDFSSPDYRVWSDNASATRNFLDLRHKLFQKVSQHPETALANSIISAELRRIFSDGMSVSQFYTSAQADIEQRFSLGSRKRLIRMKEYNLPVLAMPFSEFEPATACKLADPALHHKIRKFMELAVLRRPRMREPFESPFSVFTNSDYSKKWRFTAITNSGESQCLHIRETAADDRYLMIVANIPYFHENRIPISARSLDHWRAELLKILGKGFKANPETSRNWEVTYRRLIDLTDNIFHIHYEHEFPFRENAANLTTRNLPQYPAEWLSGPPK